MPYKKVSRLSPADVQLHAARLEAAASAGERSDYLHCIVEANTIEEAVEVLLAYADKYPRGAVLLTSIFFRSVAVHEAKTLSEFEEKISELSAVVQRVLRGC